MHRGVRPIDNQDFFPVIKMRMDLSTQQTHAHEVWEPTDNQNLGNIFNTKSSGRAWRGQLGSSQSFQAPSQFFTQGGSLLVMSQRRNWLLRTWESEVLTH